MCLLMRRLAGRFMVRMEMVFLYVSVEEKGFGVGLETLIASLVLLLLSLLPFLLSHMTLVTVNKLVIN